MLARIRTNLALIHTTSWSRDSPTLQGAAV